MMNVIKQWIQNHKEIIQKTGGIKEKKESVALKMDVALTILRELDPSYDRRIEPKPFEHERRHDFYEYHRKLV
jgi:hypothetical protein